jgi:hypothetical protein
MTILPMDAFKLKRRLSISALGGTQIEWNQGWYDPSVD